MPLKIKSAFLNRLNFEGIYNSFLGLEPRKQMFALLGVVGSLLLIVGFPISFAASELDALEEEIQNGRETQREIVRALENYQASKAKLENTEASFSKGFDATITTTMATIAEKMGIKNRIDNIQDRGSTPSELYDEVSVEVRLTQLTVSQLVEYLYNVEHHPNFFLKIKEIRIKRRYDNKQLLDVSFLASTYRLLESAGES